MAGACGSGPGAVALIGTAIMGSAMARHLAAGLPVRCGAGCPRQPARWPPWPDTAARMSAPRARRLACLLTDG